ncbi:hypothetical protein EON63_21045, partial [archaeon]
TIYHIPYTIYHIPYTIYHTPYTIHHTPYIIYHIPYTIYHIPYTIHHTPYTIHYTSQGKAAIDVVGAVLGKSGGSLLQQFFIGIFGSLSNSIPALGKCMCVRICLSYAH